MSLDTPTIIEKAMEVMKGHKRLISIIVLAGILVLMVLYAWQCGSDLAFHSHQKKLQENVNVALEDAANIKQQAANIEIKQVEAQANVNAATKELQNATYGLEDAKQQTNQALANYQRAMNQNSSTVNRTAEDLKRAVEQLDGQ